MAGETEELCRPLHLLAALADMDGPIGKALSGTPLLPRTQGAPTARGGGSGYLMMQTQETAQGFASGRGEDVRPEHLLLALIDQGDAEAVAALDRSGLDIAALRRVALGLLGAPADLGVLAIPPLIPAGTGDRPALPVEQLDARAWRILRWRQDHLPLARVRRPGDWYALSHLEGDAVWRIADRVGVDDDQRYSLAAQHRQAVDRLVHQASPAVVDAARPPESGPIYGGHRWRRIVPNFMVGWPTWFGNRWVGLRDKRFWLLTRLAYRGQPAPNS